MKRNVLLISLCFLAVFQLNAKSPSRIEKKTLSDVSAVDFDQSYGNIIVKESDSQQVNLEIQYYDGKNDKAVCELSMTKNVLSIKTILPRNTVNEEIKIDYIIAIPRKVNLAVTLKYGNIKMDDFYGNTMTANLSYSNLDAKSFINANPSISCKYGNVTIDKANDISLLMQYSNAKLNTLKTLDIQGDYCDFEIQEAQSVKGKGSYDGFRIGSIHTLNIKMNYSNLHIDTLINSLDMKCTYSDVEIKSTSKQLDNILIQGSFSDLTIGLHPDLSATFDLSSSYGDCKISKNYDVKYTVSEEKNNKVVRKGTIGNKSPKANIVISNTYADVKID